MAKIGYLSRVVRGMQMNNLKTTIAELHETTGKSKMGIFMDMVNCFLRYGAGYHDYKIFGFYQMKAKNRKTYVTRVRNKKIIMALNDQNYSDIIDKKQMFDKRFHDYLGREVLDMEETSLEQFEKFMKKNDTIFAKPCDQDSGRGIEKLNKNDFSSISEMYDYLKNKNLRMVEEVIIQHPDMNKLYPKAINCMRVVTMVIDGNPEIVYAVQKSGSRGQVLDNMGFEGICAPIDLETGKLRGLGHSEDGQIFEKHPDTGIPFIGFQIPYFKEAMELVKKASLEVPEIRYIGWDVYIGPDGPGLIEGNDYPDYAFWQLPEHTPDQIGLWPYYKSKIKGL